MHPLFAVEPIVFHIGGNAGFIHEPVVLFRTVAGIGNRLARQFMVTFGKRVEERDHGQCIPGGLKQAEVKNELILRSYLKVITRSGLPAVHRILFHAHERGVRIGFGTGVALAKDAQLFVISFKFAGMFLELPYLSLFFFPMTLFLLCRRFRFFPKRPVEFIGNIHEVCRCEILSVFLPGVVLCYGFIYLFEKSLDLLHQLGTVTLGSLAPYKSIFVGLRFDFCTVNIFHVKSDESFFRQYYHQLCEYMVDFLFHTVAEAVDGVEVRLFITRQPDKMDVTLKGGLYLTAGIKVVHVAINHGLEHHLRMVWTATALFIKFAEVFQLEVINYRVNHAHRVIVRNVLVKTLGKKNRLFGIVIPKVYLC